MHVEYCTCIRMPGSAVVNSTISWVQPYVPTCGCPQRMDKPLTYNHLLPICTAVWSIEPGIFAMFKYIFERIISLPEVQFGTPLHTSLLYLFELIDRRLVQILFYRKQLYVFFIILIFLTKAYMYCNKWKETTNHSKSPTLRILVKPSYDCILENIINYTSNAPCNFWLSIVCWMFYC